MTKRIKLTEDDIDIIHLEGEFDPCHVRFSSLEGEEVEWSVLDAYKLKQQILDDHNFRIEYNKPYKMRVVYSTLEKQINEVTKVIKHGLAEDGFDDQPETMCFDIQKILGIKI